MGEENSWGRILLQARRAIASHVLAGHEIDPAALASEILNLNIVTPPDDLRLRLEIHIRCELPAIERAVAELNRTGGSRG